MLVIFFTFPNSSQFCPISPPTQLHLLTSLFKQRIRQKITKWNKKPTTKQGSILCWQLLLDFLGFLCVYVWATACLRSEQFVEVSFLLCGSWYWTCIWLNLLSHLTSPILFLCVHGGTGRGQNMSSVWKQTEVDFCFPPQLLPNLRSLTESGTHQWPSEPLGSASLVLGLQPYAAEPAFKIWILESWAQVFRLAWQ